MKDPYDVLGVSETADDETIRGRYLELIRQFTPEHHAVKFAEIRAAYEQIRDLDRRVRYRLFARGKRDSIDELIATVEVELPPVRHGLQTLLKAHKAASR